MDDSKAYKSRGSLRRFHLEDEKQRRKVATKETELNEHGQPERGRRRTKDRYGSNTRWRSSSPPAKCGNPTKGKPKLGCTYCAPEVVNRYQRSHEAKLECKKIDVDEIRGYSSD